MERYAAGVDVGGTTIKLGLFREEGGLVEKWEIETPKGEAMKDLFRIVTRALFEKAAALSIPKEALAAIGMGLPAPVRSDGSIPWCANISLPACVPAKELSDASGLPSFVANDANVAALAEAVYGAAKGAENAVMITLGTGVGGGIIVNGEIVGGANGVAGEIGHFVVNPDETERCNCGNRGCLEQYASATGIVRTAKKILAESDRASALRAIKNLTAKDVADLAKKGDAVAAEAMETFAKTLGLAVSYLILTVDPEVVLIGGGVSKAGEYLLDLVKKHTFCNTHIAEKTGEIRLARLGNDAGIYGAAALAFSGLKKEK